MIQRKNSSPSPSSLSTLDATENSRRKKEYLVYPIIPRSEITVISGSPRTGTTSLLLTIREDYRAGRPVLGYQSYPGESVIVSLNHTRGVFRRVSTRLGIDPDDLNLVMPDDVTDFAGLVKKVKDKAPKTEALFIDGFHRLFKGGNRKDYDSGAAGTDAIQKVLDQSKLTIVATGRTAKLNSQNADAIPMERFYGSVSVTEKMATFISIERRIPSRVEDHRRVITIETQGRTEVQYWQFTKAGLLLPDSEAVRQNLDDQGSQAEQEALELLGAFPEGNEFSLSDLADILMEEFGITYRTCKRWVASWCDRGVMRKIGHGVYVMAQTQ